MTESYRNLIAWQKAKALAIEIYKCTRNFPKDELYGMTSQMRRAAISVPSNIAEGRGRHSRKEFVQFLYHARGSLLELENQLEIARDLGYFSDQTYGSILRKTEELGRILNALINRFKLELERAC
jgi:four helix bundle protein